jgi:hypothetical protein
MKGWREGDKIKYLKKGVSTYLAVRPSSATRMRRQTDLKLISTTNTAKFAETEKENLKGEK